MINSCLIFLCPQSVIFNARSILSKLHIFTFVLQSCEYDIIFITESWLTAAIPDSFLLSNSPYVILRKDRPLGHYGVIVFIKNNLQIVPVNLLLEFQSVECLIFELLFSRNIVYRFICIYNPPSCANSLTDTGILCSLLNHYTSTTNPVFCVGDFNYPNIDWSVPFSADIDWSVPFSADIDWSVPFSADIDWSVPFSADIDWSVYPLVLIYKLMLNFSFAP